MDRSMCANCNCWREEHYLRDGSFNPELACPEYVGRDAKDGELKNREKDLTAYQLWMQQPKPANVTAPVKPRWRT